MIPRNRQRLAVWILVIGARLLFTYGANHWYSHAIGQWLATNRVTVDALTDALILLAIGLVLARAVRFAYVLRNAPPIAGPAHRTPLPSTPQ
jgi:hypothetical protein